MAKHNLSNVRIKRKYLVWLKDARGLSDASVNKAATSVDRYLDFLSGKDFRSFHIEQARSFKRSLAKQSNAKSGRDLSITTIDGILRGLKAFFLWLADQTGYRSKITHSDAAYFSTDRKSARAAHSSLWKPHPSPEQTLHVIRSMPDITVIDRRNRALLAFLFLTGSREKAAITVRIQHVDLISRCANFDGRVVDTKYGKTFTTTFFPVGEEVFEVLEGWIMELKAQHLWGPQDPLFPKTNTIVGQSGLFEVSGISREPWSSVSGAVKVFKGAFEKAGLPSFSPHRIRNTLAEMAREFCTTPEDYKAWSQNLAHENVLTTFMNYRAVAHGRQTELLRSFSKRKSGF